MNKILQLSVMCILFSAQVATSANISYKLNAPTGHVHFLAHVVLGGIKINGNGEGPSGVVSIQNEKIQGDLAFSLNSLETGIGSRDVHLKEIYLETQKYPDAKLILKDVVFPNTPSDQPLSGIPFKGVLILKSIAKPIEGKFDLKRKNQTASLAAKFHFLLSSYNIKVKRLGIEVADDVEVEVTADTTSESDK